VGLVKLVVAADPTDAAQRAVELVERHAREAVTARGRFVLALSGGRGPVPFLERLVGADIDWGSTWVLQVDERVAPDGDPDRNVELLCPCLGDVPDRLARFVAVPVDVTDAEASASAYGQLVEEAAGRPPVLDLVHLGLGADGHTASLLPGDPATAAVGDTETATSTGEYEGRRRITLTRPVLDRARHRLWFVVGDGKVQALSRLLHHDPTVPAGLIRSEGATVVVDRAALGLAPAVG
jgi:6-phosphogluconolactonase